MLTTIGVALMPTLLSYSPLLLIALAPLGRHLLLAAPVTAFAPFLVVATLRRLLTCVLSYMVGEAYGEAGIGWVKQHYPRAGRLVRVLERVFRRAGPLVVLFAPGPIICALAGVTRMRWVVFLPIATLGQMAVITITHRVGAALQEFILPILAWLEENMIVTTLVCVALVLAYRFVRRNREAAAVPPLPVPPSGSEP